jgi:hypothetical protein
LTTFSLHLSRHRSLEAGAPNARTSIHEPILTEATGLRWPFLRRVEVAGRKEAQAGARFAVFRMLGVTGILVHTCVDFNGASKSCPDDCLHPKFPSLHDSQIGLIDMVEMTTLE